MFSTKTNHALREDVKAGLCISFPLNFNRPRLNLRKPLEQKSNSTYAIFIHDAPVDARTAEQITHCVFTLSLLVSETAKDGGGGLDSAMGERER